MGDRSDRRNQQLFLSLVAANARRTRDQVVRRICCWASIELRRTHVVPTAEQAGSTDAPYAHRPTARPPGCQSQGASGEDSHRWANEHHLSVRPTGHKHLRIRSHQNIGSQNAPPNLAKIARCAMNLPDAAQRVAFSPGHREDLDSSYGPIGWEDGQACRRCEGRGWFRWHGVVRWCRPSCIAPHIDVELLCTIEPRSQIWGS